MGVSEWARNMKKGNADRNEGCVQIGDVLIRPVKCVTTSSQPTAVNALHTSK